MLSFEWGSCWCRALLFNIMGGDQTFAASRTEVNSAGQTCRLHVRYKCLLQM